MKTVSEDFDDIFQLSGEIIRYPSFPEQEIELEKRITIQSIRAQLEQPFTVAFSQLREMMYQNHPYALSTLGTENTVSQITRYDIQKFYQTYFRPDCIVISIVGKISNVPWSVTFPLIDMFPRHPSQIYEALLEGVILFLILITFIYNRKIKICAIFFNSL